MPNILAGSENPDLACTRPETDYSAAAPLIALLRGPDEWIANKTLIAALGLTPNKGRSILPANSPRWAILGAETKIAVPSGAAVEVAVRLFSKRGVALVSMTTMTNRAVAFRKWMAECAVEAANAGGEDGLR